MIKLISRIIRLPLVPGSLDKRENRGRKIIEMQLQHMADAN